MYSVKECYLTLQGEGAMTGRAAVFVRFAGCNLWNGLENSRASAICDFCDTDFIGTDGPGGGKFATAAALAAHIKSFWPEAESSAPYLVCTGGEPLLQLDDALLSAFKKLGFIVAIETNGTIAAPDGIDWVCVSPKQNADLVQKSGNELKLVYPQKGQDPADYLNLDFAHFYLQPMDGVDIERNIEDAIDYCKKNPQWRLSLQSHKLVGMP